MDQILGAGHNLLLADKSPGASQLQTRNGAGKTSLIEVIHFLAGSQCRPGSMFRRNQMLTRSTWAIATACCWPWLPNWSVES